MSPRAYRLGRRQPSVGRTRAAILGAARDLLAANAAGPLSVGAVAARAGVSRLTIYHHFGSRAALLDALAPAPTPAPADPATDPADLLRQRISNACSTWSGDPALYRQLPARGRQGEPDADRGLAERLAAEDRLRPGCSIKEAQDVIGILTAFETFDRLHQDGRRTAATVAEMLMRLAGAILG
ncbi:MAG TPA: helix-turn-helix domain-containing protein [Candidatus Dormibacteraeota bacterium]|nr:helix-turn-helix domain-containing protein [Candidatus Dormibacteraeota bacterium]